MREPTAAADAALQAEHLTPLQLERIASSIDLSNGSAEDGLLIAHLDTCQYCQRRLDEVAAEETFWRQSGQLLRPDELDAATATKQDGTQLVAASDGANVAGAEALTAMVAALLGPSEREDSLGRLGRFEVLGIIGSGGMGIVLKCRDVDIDRVVAIKVPAAHLWRSAEALAILEREAQSAASVVHPHVIAIYQVDRWRDVPYLVMPYFPGPSLDRRIQQTGPLPLTEAIRITRQMAEALAAAHAHGVIHRDVKPGNILLGRGVERAVLSDFGLAKVQSEATLTASGMIAGTPSYLSPEQASGGRIGPSGDLFSLGSVLWTMLTGEVPWAGLHPHAIVARIATGELPRPAEVSGKLPPWVWQLVDWLHQLDPQARPASAGELADLLNRCEQHMADPESNPLPQRLHTPAHRRPLVALRWWLAAAGGLLLVMASAAAIVLTPPAGEPGDSQPASVQPATAAGISPAAGDGPASTASQVPSAEPQPEGESSVEPAPLEEAERPEEAVGPMLDEIETSLEQIFSELRHLQESKP